MSLLVEILVCGAGGVVAIATSRLVLGGILALTFRSARRGTAPITKAAGA